MALRMGKTRSVADGLRGPTGVEGPVLADLRGGEVECRGFVAASSGEHVSSCTGDTVEKV